jgi:hypothetical protein
VRILKEDYFAVGVRHPEPTRDLIMSLREQQLKRNQAKLLDEATRTYLDSRIEEYLSLSSSSALLRSSNPPVGTAVDLFPHAEEVSCCDATQKSYQNA